MSEAEIQTAIMLEFGALPWLRIWRANVGGALVKGRFVHFGAEGQPDLMGLIAPSGRSLGIEVKSSTGKQRESQKRFQAMWEKFGGIYILARSVMDVRVGLQTRGFSCA